MLNSKTKIDQFLDNLKYQTFGPDVQLFSHQLFDRYSSLTLSLATAVAFIFFREVLFPETIIALFISGIQKINKKLMQ